MRDITRHTGGGGDHCEACGELSRGDFRYCPICGSKRSEGPAPVVDQSEDSAPAAHTALITRVEDGATAAPDRETSRQRLVAVAAVGAALVVLGVLLGNWAWQRHLDGPVRSAFMDADEQFVDGMDRLLASESIADLQLVAEDMTRTAGELSDARARASARDSELGRQARDVLDAELSVAMAVARLDDLSVADLSAWVEARELLVRGMESLEQVSAVHTDLTGDHRPAHDDLVPALQSVIGGEAATTSASALRLLFDEMERASVTVELRQVATRANDNAAGLRAALAGFPTDSPEAQSLSSAAEIYETLAGLAQLDADHLDDWATVRSDLTAAASAFRSDEALRGDAQAAVNAVDRLVERARTRLRTWRERYQAVTARKRATISSAEKYEADMTRLLDRYSGLRAGLSDWIDRVEDPSQFVTYDEGYRVLSEAQYQRQLVRDDMSGLTVPPDVSSAHNVLIGVIDDAIEAVGAAYEGTSDAQYCATTCYYADTPGWQRFAAESDRITEAFDSAVESWQAATRTVVARARAIQPPARPTV